MDSKYGSDFAMSRQDREERIGWVRGIARGSLNRRERAGVCVEGRLRDKARTAEGHALQALKYQAGGFFFF